MTSNPEPLPKRHRATAALITLRVGQVMGLPTEQVVREAASLLRTGQSRKT